MNGHKSGFVSILGRPNAGKSTLLNVLVGQKIAIVADKPQTTRTAIQGVMTTPEAQVIFIDTPGIHRSSSAINRRMMEAVRGSLEERDLLILTIDASKPLFGRGARLAADSAAGSESVMGGLAQDDEMALSMLRAGGPPVIAVFNKIDALESKQTLLPMIEEYRRRFAFEDYLPVSALTGEGIEELRAGVIRRLAEGPEYFPPDHVTDQPARFLAAELIREKILQATRQEVPHSTTVLVDKWEELPRLLRIYATIYVEREGQKAIVIGARGAMLKRIGTLAREEMEKLFDTRIHLDLHVKVEPGWRDKNAFLNSLDWRTMTGRDDH